MCEDARRKLTPSSRFDDPVRLPSLEDGSCHHTVKTSSPKISPLSCQRSWTITAEARWSYPGRSAACWRVTPDWLSDSWRDFGAWGPALQRQPERNPLSIRRRQVRQGAVKPKTFLLGHASGVSQKSRTSTHQEFPDSPASVSRRVARRGGCGAEVINRRACTDRVSTDFDRAERMGPVQFRRT